MFPLQDNLLDPLGMTATSLYVADPQKHNQIAHPLLPHDSDFRIGWESSPEIYMKWQSGGGGMVSTLADLARFSQMLLNGGALDGKRYLSTASFVVMTSDHVGPFSGVVRDYCYFPGDGFGFGLGFGVRTDPGNAKPPPPGSIGELKPYLSWCSLSDRYFRRLVSRCGVGLGLLDVDGVASEWRSGRIACST